TLRVGQKDAVHIGLRVHAAAGFIADAGFPDRLEALLNEHETDPELLTIEIREVADLGLSSKGSDILTRLRLKSVKLALDDFGAPGSALHGWYTLPFGELKLDRCLVSELATAEGAAVLAGGLIEVAHRLDMTCCAVGVETPRQLEILDELGCDLAQGFHIGAPQPASKLPEALADWTADSAAAPVPAGYGQ